MDWRYHPFRKIIFWKIWPIWGSGLYSNQGPNSLLQIKAHMIHSHTFCTKSSSLGPISRSKNVFSWIWKFQNFFREWLTLALKYYLYSFTHQVKIWLLTLVTHLQSWTLIICTFTILTGFRATKEVQIS